MEMFLIFVTILVWALLTVGGVWCSDFGFKAKVVVTIIGAVFLIIIIVQEIGLKNHPQITVVVYDDILAVHGTDIEYKDTDGQVKTHDRAYLWEDDIFIDDEYRLEKTTYKYGWLHYSSWIYYVPEDMYKSGEY